MSGAPHPAERKPPRKMSVADQVRRTRELDAIRLRRRLTPSEQAEADNLADRAYFRLWRARQREQEAAIAARLSSLASAAGMNGGAA